MSEHKDGGPAFPCAPVLHENGPDSYWSQAGQGGMSLRDYFAAAALNGLLAGGHTKACMAVWQRDEQGFHVPRDTRRDCAEGESAMWAYSLADAMLKAREQ